MSSAALVPSLLERAEANLLRRPFLSVCPAAPAAPTTPSKAAAPLLTAAAEKVTSVPAAPTVARLHGEATPLSAAAPAALAPALAAPVAPVALSPAADGLAAPEPESASTPASGTRPSAESLESELVAMLPSLERRAYRWCRDPAEAQDLAQDTVLRALGNSATFDSEGHLRAWLYTVLRNLFISRRRRDQSWQRASVELCGLAQQGSASPASSFLTPSVERAIARLPEAFARVIRLVDLEDYSYADAASLLGVPVGTVMSRLFRARQRLARDLPALV
jgi:RNA polymerase sigma-70 factor (ECF subfamily)